jgi:transposase
MIVIGADIHKRNHMLVAVGAQTGEMRAELQIAADEQGHQAALRWARELDTERVWALEDCRQVSRRLEQALLAAGERVVRVAPRLTGLSRRADRRAGKSDPIDALAVARVAVREGPERLPGAFLDEETMEIRLLADHREDLVAELAPARPLPGAGGAAAGPLAGQRGAPAAPRRAPGAALLDAGAHRP